jgi:hypothetical protein
LQVGANFRGVLVAQVAVLFQTLGDDPFQLRCHVGTQAHGRKRCPGYGSSFFTNSGCFTETVPGANSGFSPGSLSSCTADTRALVEGTAGFWFKVYDGSKDKANHGRAQWGAQYSYVTRNTWSGVGGEPNGIDGMVFTSFRYYLP